MPKGGPRKGAGRPKSDSPRVTKCLRLDPKTVELLQEMPADNLSRAVDLAVAYYHGLPW